jgi:hypothetical protein
MINWHRTLRRSGFFRFLLATSTAKNRFDNCSGCCAASIKRDKSVSVILNNSLAGVAAYRWACMATLVYLKYECHVQSLLHPPSWAIAVPQMPVGGR